MPIYLGGGEIDKVYVGSSLADAVYYQGEKVWPPFEPTLVSVTTPGSFSVPWPAGATKVDRVLCGGGGEGGWSFGAGGNGGNTSATVGASTLTASGGNGGSGGAPVTTPGGSPGQRSWNGRVYDGGVGGAVNQPGGSPGGGGGGSGGFLGGGEGGSAGQWNSDTIAKPSGATHITGTVGAGGNNNFEGVEGGDGVAHFYFYT